MLVWLGKETCECLTVFLSFIFAGLCAVNTKEGWFKSGRIWIFTNIPIYIYIGIDCIFEMETFQDCNVQQISNSYISKMHAESSKIYKNGNS